MLQHRVTPGTGPLFALVLVAVAAGPARAQRMPAMATLDRGDRTSRVGLDFAAAILDDTPGSGDAALRFDFFFQFVGRLGIGVYGDMPIAHSVSDRDDKNALGNLDIGALYVARTKPLTLVFRAGVALPTADDDLDRFVINYFASWTRLSDIAQAIPNVTYLRLSFSPLFHAKRLFLRADVGADIAIDRDDDATDLEPDRLFRLNVGGGLDLGDVALMVELVNLATTEDFDEFTDNEDSFVNTVAVTARFMDSSLKPYLTAGVPMDTFGLDTIDFFVGAGLQAQF